MPELPEVEHQARALRRFLSPALRIERAEADKTQLLKGNTTPKLFADALSGRVVSRIERKGKLLLLCFDPDVFLVCHLGMSGRWVRRERTDEAPRNSKARLLLEDGRVLHLVDPRMLGRLEITTLRDLRARKEWKALGPDPLLDGIDVDRLLSAFAKTKRMIKVLLLDQSILAGLGNIQATEALFLARLHPARLASSLTRHEVEALARAISETIEHTLAAHAHEDEIVLLSDRTDAPNPFLIYGRVGEACPRCGKPISSITIGGRTSPFCPRCQRPIRSAPRRARG